MIKKISKCVVAALMGLVGGLALPASAGDFAQVEVHGFSDDGHTFAFEQYGIQDGSGFPYSDIFVINVVDDTWIKPFPLRLRDEAEDLDSYYDYELIDRVRGANQKAARNSPHFARIKGLGQTVGHNPPTEISSDPHSLIVNPRMVVPPIDNLLDFHIEEYPMKAGACASYGAETKGFRLTLRHQGAERVLNEDKKVPKSRGCPLRYRIERVVTYYPKGLPPVFAVLVLMETHGFEGPDGRYLAITGQF